MKVPHDFRDFTTIFAFFAIAVTLAVTAVFLPSGREKKEIRDLKIEYGIETKSSASFKEKSIFDFLRFQLDPVEVEPRVEIKRSQQPSNKKIVPIEQSEPLLVRSPQKFVVMLEDNTTGILEELTSFVRQEREIRYEAIQTINAENCAAIENARAAADCRGEIYFQKAISEKNIELCGKIENEKLKRRCQTYIHLIPEEDAPKN
ncbi:hypothetical protein KKF38_01800 [Patescibacteria group bacterium]|nr:hypothetical protein [Patescibacteria group bacterium]